MLSPFVELTDILCYFDRNSPHLPFKGPIFFALLLNVPTNNCAESDACTPECTKKKKKLSHATIRVTQNREISSVSYDYDLFAGELPSLQISRFDMQNLEI